MLLFVTGENASLVVTVQHTSFVGRCFIQLYNTTVSIKFTLLQIPRMSDDEVLIKEICTKGTKGTENHQSNWYIHRSAVR